MTRREGKVTRVDRVMAMKVMRREKILREYRWQALGVQAVTGRVTFTQPE